MPSTQASATVPDAPHLRVQRDAPMSLSTTWRIGGPADFLVRAPSPADVVAATRWAAWEGVPVIVIGGGSNLLVGDGGIRGLVIVARTPGEKAVKLVAAKDRGDAVELTVATQAPLSWVGRYASERGWAGMDWGVGLPGTIGGATVNNAGAHGTEQKDSLVAVEVLTADGEITMHDRAWLEPAYRHTRIKASPRPRGHTVLSATFLLPKSDPAHLIAHADEHAEYRRRTQPTGQCAGSTFANPPGDSAGRLLEAAGLKGVAVGPVSFSVKHSNFIVNAGGGTAAQVRELIAIGRDTVRQRFGVVLATEIEEVGER